MGLGFLVLPAGIALADPQGTSAFGWLFLSCVLQSIGELLISPVGLSLATKISPRVFRSQTVALYFLSVALGTALSGSLAGYYRPEHEARYFGSIGTAAIVVGLIVAGLSPMIRRLMVGVR